MSHSGRLRSTVEDRSSRAKMLRAESIDDPEAAEFIREFSAADKEKQEELRAYVNGLVAEAHAIHAARRSAKSEGFESANNDPMLISKEAAAGDSKASGALDGRHADDERDEGSGSDEVEPDEFEPLEDLSGSDSESVIAASDAGSDEQHSSDAISVDTPDGDAAESEAADAVAQARPLACKDVRDKFRKDDRYDCGAPDQRLTLPIDRSPELKIAFERYVHELVRLFESTRHSDDIVDDIHFAWVAREEAEEHLSSARKILSGREEQLVKATDPESGRPATTRRKSESAALVQQARADVAAKQQSFERAQEKVAEATARKRSADHHETANLARYDLAFDELEKAYIAFAETRQSAGPSTREALNSPSAVDVSSSALQLDRTSSRSEIDAELDGRCEPSAAMSRYASDRQAHVRPTRPSCSSKRTFSDEGGREASKRTRGDENHGSGEPDEQVNDAAIKEDERKAPPRKQQFAHRRHVGLLRLQEE
ncbi:hypothetical protein BMF94_1866 [Rhodotorula taiwanensis]|uniref:Uncharacterized protein n=1 Tax=Rhodotorula taiwanensis TaxID=741276 RepID=A0A2S5BDP6_9BASI|nr:hypothetical protein BMF94_1866 [Rhodotorula taiwanensis]